MNIQEIYDELCKALTCYEAADGVEHDPDYDYGNALYQDIVGIVNKMAEKIN